jgi:hypothetical protein
MQSSDLNHSDTLTPLFANPNLQKHAYNVNYGIELPQLGLSD